MMGGGSDYVFADGVTLEYDGDQSGRTAGNGIIQIVDGATVSTGTDNTSISGFGSLLVGAIDLDSLAGGLDFEEHVAELDGAGVAGTSSRPNG